MNFIIKISLVLFVADFCSAVPTIINISSLGGKPNTDIAKAVSSAWTQACASTTEVKIVIPAGTYQMGAVDIRGPCKAPIEIQVDGTILAPENPNDFNNARQWIKFTYINALTLSGSGVFDAQGAMSWKLNDCHKNQKCRKLMSFGFTSVTNSIIRGITSKDSKHFHVNILGCNNITFDGFKISAPHESVNTDGIHIGRSTEVKVINSNIATGDDCVSLGHGNKNITIQNVNCGPGHGISVGSLGRYPNETPVEGIVIKNCTMTNTDNGIRIKAWPNTPIKVTVTDMLVEDVVMDNVKFPIIIDQEYCPYNLCTRQNPSQVKISKISFKNIRGTSATRDGVTLMCSSGTPCEGIELSDINLRFKGAVATTKCSNVKPTITGKVVPCSA
ncbi:hypothetical protein VNO77_21781 [Canavalia gladiata]|uniref:Polygalacturonase n=1 Tax=Canavalia gladiata TaxID=3824 RepID=A0AAN9QDX1_CANGL